VILRQTKQRDLILGSAQRSHDGFGPSDHAVRMRLCFLIMERDHRENRLKDALLARLRELVFLERSRVHLIGETAGRCPRAGWRTLRLL
jgi:hypothetical protein